MKKFKTMSSDINDRHGLYVEVRNNDVTRALRKLKKLMNSEGMIKDMRKNEFYEKPSAVRRREKAQARKRWIKEQEKNKDNLQKKVDFAVNLYYIKYIARIQRSLLDSARNGVYRDVTWLVAVVAEHDCGDTEMLFWK